MTDKQIEKLMQIEDPQTLKNAIKEIIALDDIYNDITSVLQYINLNSIACWRIANQNMKEGKSVLDNRFIRYLKHLIFAGQLIQTMYEEAGNNEGNPAK